MNPKYFHTSFVFFSSWVVLKVWSVTGLPRAVIHDLNESMLALLFEKDDLLFLTNACKIYILNTKQFRTNVMLYRVHLAMSGIRTHNLVAIGTDCIGSCKSNSHTIMTTTAPSSMRCSFGRNYCTKIRDENKITENQL